MTKTWRGLFIAVRLVLILPASGCADFQVESDILKRGDFDRAWEYWRPLAYRGDAFAQLILGYLYDKGLGGPQDDAEAAHWYRRAAEQGQASAQYNLGLMYVMGQGVPKNDVLAYMWVALSAAQGCERKSRVRDSLESSLTPEQLTEAQRLAREWRPKGNGGEVKGAAAPRPISTPQTLGLPTREDNLPLTQDSAERSPAFIRTAAAAVTAVWEVLSLVLGFAPPPIPGNSLCVGTNCNTLCSGWDCSSSYISKDHPAPRSLESREAVSKCFEQIDPETRDLAKGHFELFARIGPLTWGPARRWNYQETLAAEELVYDIKECMEQQEWIYCCKGLYCELNLGRSTSQKWFCQRRP